MHSENLTLIVHDYDPVSAESRSKDLRAAVPGADVPYYHNRQKLLRSISELQPVGPGERWPLALIDLQGDSDRNARGEHLLATINEHPQLRDRVALVAFTRYGFESRDEVLEAKGARGVLSPIDLRNQEELRDELELLASGSTNFVHIGEPPSREQDKEVVRRLTGFFPQLEDESLDDRARWKRARRILRICQLDREGFDDTAIRELGLLEPKVGRREFERLQNELLISPAALAAGLIAPMDKRPSLGRVIDVLAPCLHDTPLIWDVTNERERLEGTGQLAWIRERVADRYPPEGAPAEGSDDAWIPPDYLQALRRYLFVHAELSAREKRSHASAEALFQRTSTAVERVAEELGLGPEQARHYITHAVMCLDDAEAERSREAG